MSQPLWQPSDERKAKTALSRFLATVRAPDGSVLTDAAALHRASIADPAWFWSTAWRTLGVKGDMGPAPHLVDGNSMLDARFFPGGTLNFAENALSRDGDAPAIVFRGEDKVRRRMSWDELRGEVGKLQATLAEAGLRSGDRVAAILPNLPEAVVGVLAASSLGAVWSSCSPDFGIQGVLDRFGQIEPRVLIASDGYYYNGKPFDITEKLEAILARLPTVELVIVVSYTGGAEASVARLAKPGAASTRRTATWATAVSSRPAAELRFPRFPFSHPLYILFSSGTTGAPKCIVHSAGGSLLKLLVEHRLHSDIEPGDRVFYFTTLGWMMWNWLVAVLASGATLMLYDGSPFHPDGNVLWDYAAEERFTHFGTSAKYIDTLKKVGLAPDRTHDLSSLETILSTGSPLAPESFDYVYGSVKRDVHLASMSGGTDICGCFVIGDPLGPVWRGEIQMAGFGMAAEVFDADGRPLTDGKGELVCTRPFPSQPLGFWGDKDSRRYRAAYYERFENVWHHGDFAEWTEHGGMIIHGRSDATLNPGGVRIGTAEIYRQVEQMPEVQEGIVIGQEWDRDVRVVLFVVLKAGCSLTAELAERIKRQIRVGASPRHVPARIVQVADIPRTKSGKITELAVRDVVHGREVKNTEALANPEALDLYRDLPELRS